MRASTRGRRVEPPPSPCAHGAAVNINHHFGSFDRTGGASPRHCAGAAGLRDEHKNNGHVITRSASPVSLTSSDTVGGERLVDPLRRPPTPLSPTRNTTHTPPARGTCVDSTQASSPSAKSSASPLRLSPKHQLAELGIVAAAEPSPAMAGVLFRFGVHFFNPVPVLPLVELVPIAADRRPTPSPGPHAFAEDVLDKHVIRCQDRAGFVVNALLIPYLLSAIRMLESGFATAEDIDTGMVQGCAHPMGPLALADLIGLDTTACRRRVDVRGVQGAALRAAAAAAARMVDAGLLGRKTGRGSTTTPVPVAATA